MNFLFLFFSLSVFVNVEGQPRDQFVPIGNGFSGPVRASMFQPIILFPYQESRNRGYETVKGLRKKGWFDNRDSGSEWEDSFFLKQIRLVLKQKLKDFFKTSPQKRLASRFQKKWTSQRTGISSTWPFLRCSGNEKICGYKKVNVW